MNSFCLPQLANFVRFAYVKVCIPSTTYIWFFSHNIESYFVDLVVCHLRLVTDRETGKPKGYGFCEYKDEETALSARRNLQGYDINGRQLRVDFAENDKNADKNREQVNSVCSSLCVST